MADVTISGLLAGTPLDTDLLETETAGGAERRLNRGQVRATAAETKTRYESNADTNAFTDAEQSKLVGVEAGATADQTNGEIKTAYEANADTNEFSDAEQAKLAGVDTGATDDTTVDAHIADTTNAHDATAVGFTPNGTIAATDTQAAVQEVRDEAPLISSEDELTGQMQIAVVATLPGSPDADTIYFVTT